MLNDTGQLEPPSPIRVLVVDDHPLFRKGVISLLETEADIQTVGEVGSLEEALEWLGHERADVVLLDNNLPGENGISGLPKLLEKRQGLQAVILTICDNEDEFLRAIRSGACGYLLKDALPQRLIEGVRNAAHHELQVSDRMVRDFLRHQSVDDEPGSGRRKTDAPSVFTVTERDRELLLCLCMGNSNKEIGKVLELSPNTVRNSLQRLQERFGLQNRVQLALFANDNTLI